MPDRQKFYKAFQKMRTAADFAAVLLLLFWPGHICRAGSVCRVTNYKTFCEKYNHLLLCYSSFPIYCVTVRIIGHGARAAGLRGLSFYDKINTLLEEYI